MEEFRKPEIVSEEETILQQVIPWFKEQIDYHQNSADAQSEEGVRSREQLAEYMYLVTHFILFNGDDREYLEKFWAKLYEADEQLSWMEKEKFKAQLRSFQKGVLTQVAAYKIFEALNMNPRLATPQDDIKYKIDLWIVDNTPVQVKGRTSGMVKILRLEDKNKDEKRPKGVTNLINKHLKKFEQHVRQYEGNLDPSGVLIAIDWGSFDAITGEPTAESIRTAREELGVVES